jgi:hypothetical protein
MDLTRGGGCISPSLVLWIGTCPSCLSPMNGDPGSTQILTRYCGAKSQTISQLVNLRITPTSRSPQFSPSRLLKHLRMESVHTPHHILPIRTEPWDFVISLAQNKAIHM